jgi:Predicted integral membrane protein (DUF2269)
MSDIATTERERADVRPDVPRPSRRRLSSRGLKALLTAHIVFSVALLGDSAGFLAVAIRTSTLDDPALIHDSAKTLSMFSLVFGIPLSFGALLTGIALGLFTRWGVFKYPWVTAKLLIIVSVMVVGGVVIGPALNDVLDGDADATNRLIAAAAYDVAVLTIATVLGVFKPGRRIRRRSSAMSPSRGDAAR